MTVKDQAAMTILQRLGRETLLNIWGSAILAFTGSALWFGGRWVAGETTKYLDSQSVLMTKLTDTQGQQADALDVMSTFASEATNTLGHQQERMDAMGKLIESSSLMEQDIYTQLREMTALMEQANKMMGGSLEDRTEMKTLLSQIDVGIQQLTEQMKKLDPDLLAAPPLD